jgi:DNA replication protein DnaC
MRARRSPRLQASATHLKRWPLAAPGDALLTRAQEGQGGAREVLALVLAEEQGVREGRRFTQVLTGAGRPYHTTLDGCDVAFQQAREVVRGTELAPRRCVEPQGHALLRGPTGTGKTHVAVSLALAAGQRGGSISCPTLDDVVQQLKTVASRHQWQPTLQTSLHPALLVLDAGGDLPLQRVEATDRGPLSCRRDERGSVTVPSPKACAAWAEL